MKKFLATLTALILVVVMATPCVALELTKKEAKQIVISLTKACIENAEITLSLIELQLTLLDSRLSLLKIAEDRVDAEREITSIKRKVQEMHIKKQKVLADLKQAKEDLAVGEALPDE